MTEPNRQEFLELQEQVRELMEGSFAIRAGHQGHPWALTINGIRDTQGDMTGYSSVITPEGQTRTQTLQLLKDHVFIAKVLLPEVD